MLKLCLQRALRPAVHKLLPAAAAVVVGAPRLPWTGRHTPRCCMGTHGRNEPREPLNSPKRAKEFIYRLQPKERTCLLVELQSFESIAIAQETLEPSPPTAAQIRYVLFHNAIPFVGFGFLDNAIMIAAGTQIELSIGVTLGISTMAGPAGSFYFQQAVGILIHWRKLWLYFKFMSVPPVLLLVCISLDSAALGNLVSDLAGLGLAGYVEALATRLGMQVPDLTPKQVDMWQTRLSCHMGKAIGVSIGCILGMFPLLFLSDDDDKEKEAQPSSDTASQSS